MEVRDEEHAHFKCQRGVLSVKMEASVATMDVRCDEEETDDLSRMIE
jgi:hypothetical protein